MNDNNQNDILNTNLEKQQNNNDFSNLEQSQNSINLDNNSDNKSNKEKSYIKYIIIGSCVLIIGIILIIIFTSNKTVNNKRVKLLTSIKENPVLKFKIDDIEYKIGDKLNFYKKDFNYIESFDKLEPDSVLVSPFSKDNQTDFFGFIYCNSTNYCKYEDSILIKANFYKNSKVIIDNDLSYNSYYSDFEKKLGKPVGKYYQDKTMYVWSLGTNIGDPYIIAGFDTGGFIPSNKVNELRLGVWWYKNEIYDTVVKES